MNTYKNTFNYIEIHNQNMNTFKYIEIHNQNMVRLSLSHQTFTPGIREGTLSSFSLVCAQILFVCYLYSAWTWQLPYVWWCLILSLASMAKRAGRGAIMQCILDVALRVCRSSHGSLEPKVRSKGDRILIMFGDSNFSIIRRRS